MPTSEHKEEEVDEMYERVEELLDSETKGKDYTIVMGDFNAVMVGEGKEEKHIEHYGLGHRNQRGEKLVEFCRRRQMYISKIHGFPKKNERGIHEQCLEIQEDTRLTTYS